ncbi:25S rRNA (cytosine(2870)-C(5))-methyltransferase [Malassezia psittaci]|uniref:Nucleolar protein 2 n=1 Tax=Malassezia psittaci TaxID=1821823 RepID=A0AAF0JFQ8_9BASI|nr:25S rRNA (cytosine(2870)-C(5))-methyltransferase [Malassezia psittaci]
MGRRAKNKQAPPEAYAEPKAKVAKVQKTKSDSAHSGLGSSAKTAHRDIQRETGEKVSKPKAVEPIGAQSLTKQNGKSNKSALLPKKPTKQSKPEDNSKQSSASRPKKVTKASATEPEQVSSADQVLQSLGIKSSKPLSERQKKKLRAEAERLEELLKSHGYALDDEDQDEELNEDETGDESEESGVSGSEELGLEDSEDIEDDLSEDGSEDVEDEDEDEDEDEGSHDEDEDDSLDEDESQEEDDSHEDIKDIPSKSQPRAETKSKLVQPKAASSSEEALSGDDLSGDDLPDDDLSDEGLPDDEFDDGLELEENEADSDESQDLSAGDEDLLDEDQEDADQSGFLLPTVEEEEEEERAPLNLQLVQMRLREVAKILSNVAELGEPGRSRADYMERLSKDIQQYYGYNEFLTTMFLELFPPEEAIEFFEANEVPRPVTIRVNSLKTRRRDLAQKLINRGVSVEPVGAWSKVGLQVFESPVPIGATPEYLVGDYMLQAVSSFLPCIALAPQRGERVLDMASAPGGKVTYLSALMQNTGCVFANDSNKARIKSLTANIHRMGCRNVVVCNYDGRQFPKVMGGFDRVMLDSPCSGTGVISKDPSVKTNKSKRDFILLTQLQKQLILCAIDSVSPKSETGGYVVYSTCSVTVEENEEVVEYALRKRPNVRIVPSGIEFGRDGFKAFRGKTFDENMPLCRRIFPHAHNLDGFFVCKLKVELPNKGAKRRQELQQAVVEAATDLDLQPTPAKKARAAQPQETSLATPFHAEEDQAIIERAIKRKRH